MRARQASSASVSLIEARKFVDGQIAEEDLRRAHPHGLVPLHILMARTVKLLWRCGVPMEETGPSRLMEPDVKAAVASVRAPGVGRRVLGAGCRAPG